MPDLTKQSDKPKATELAVPTTTEGIRELVKRAEKGDKATVPALRKLLENPAYIGMLGGDVARYAEESFVKAMCGEDLVVREAVHAKLTAMRKELFGANPTTVERLLTERAVACWLHVQDAELRYTHAQKDMTFKQGDFHQRRMDAANRRYLAALKALALVRRLALPALQINLAKKQVNVVAPTAVSGIQGE